MEDLSKLKITGDDIMQILEIPPSKEVGEIKKQIILKIEAGELGEDRKSQLEFLHSLKNERQ